MTQYFLDSYAIIEIFRGNPRLARFRRVEAATTLFQIAESYYKLLELDLAKEAGEMYRVAFPCAISPPEDVLRSAMEFRLRERAPRGERYSYADAIGYAVARWLGIPFLTGDEGFRGREGVEWVR